MRWRSPSVAAVQCSPSPSSSCRACAPSIRWMCRDGPRRRRGFPCHRARWPGPGPRAGRRAGRDDVQAHDLAVGHRLPVQLGGQVVAGFAAGSRPMPTCQAFATGAAPALARAAACPLAICRACRRAGSSASSRMLAACIRASIGARHCSATAAAFSGTGTRTSAVLMWIEAAVPATGRQPTAVAPGRRVRANRSWGLLAGRGAPGGADDTASADARL